MIITSDWDMIELHDATVQDINQEDRRLAFWLAGAHILPEHPCNEAKALLTLPKALLVFESPQSIAVRAYWSETGSWLSLDPPFPRMQSIAEVLIDAQGVWRLTGFSADGRWLEWTIHPAGPVRLEA